MKAIVHIFGSLSVGNAETNLRDVHSKMDTQWLGRVALSAGEFKSRGIVGSHDPFMRKVLSSLGESAKSSFSPALRVASPANSV